MYVKLADGKIVPDLVLDDENRRNWAIMSSLEGSAFVISDRGFLLTNKHLAAGWRLPYFDDNLDTEVFLIDVTKDSKKAPKASIVKLRDLDSEDYKSLKDWIPESGGLIFDTKKLRVVGPYNFPDPSKNEQHNFEGRNEDLEVTFSGKRLGINATLVRSSNESDAALIKIDSPEALQPVDIAAAEDSPAAGDHIIVLGFPAVAAKTYVLSETIENGKSKSNVHEVPQPYVTDGIVALVSNPIVTKGGVTVEGAQGDIIQLTINSTGAGNSGGPVFNSAGKVIGLFTYSIRQGSTLTSAAVPIRYGRELLKSQ